MKKSHFLGLLVVIPLAAYIVYLFSMRQSEELQAIMKASSSLASLQTAIEMERSIQDKGTTLGKPDIAEVRISYQPKDNQAQANVLQEIVSTLADNGWNEEEVSTVRDSGYYRATYSIDGYLVRSSVVGAEDSDNVSVRFYRISNN